MVKRTLVIVDNSYGRGRFTAMLIVFTKRIVKELSSTQRTVDLDVRVVQSIESLMILSKECTFVCGVILSGSDSNISEHKTNLSEHDMNHYALSRMNVPVFGICYGMHVLAKYHGVTVKRLEQPLLGYVCNVIVRPNSNDSILHGVRERFACFHSHGDFVTVDPKNSEWNIEVCSITHCPVDVSPLSGIRTDTIVTALEYDVDGAPYHAGVQFHVEASGKTGETVMKNFISRCVPSRTWK